MLVTVFFYSNKTNPPKQIYRGFCREGFAPLLYAPLSSDLFGLYPWSRVRLHYHLH